MEFINNLLILFKKSLDFLPYISGFLIFLISCFKILFNYIYGKKCEETFGIPYSYFLFDFVKSIIETLLYMFVLIICIFLMLYIIYLAKDERHLFTLISYTLAHSATFSLYQLGIYIHCKNKSKRFYIAFVLIFPLIISILIFVFQKKFVILFIFFISIFLMYVFGFLLYNTINIFINSFDPKNEKYQIVCRNDHRFAIIAKNHNIFVLIKLDDNDKIIKSDYILVDNIINTPIEYKKIF